jgi:ABC-type Fe3+-hydroxamate transport system substrate-binding protein
MKSFTDQIGRALKIKETPKRIISLVPSQTELLASLGLENEVIGITKFCVHPNNWFRNKTRVGGTKQIKLDLIHSLQPDLIIANKEENTKEQIEALANDFPVWVSDVNDLESAFEMIAKVGEITGRSDPAADLIGRIKTNFEKLNTPANNPLKAAYFIWPKPYMVSGGDTFISKMMEIAGFQNIFQSENRYPEINLDHLKGLEPDCILLSSEPYPFKEKHVNAFKEEFPHAKVLIVDGEYFSWYGSRLEFAPDYFNQIRMLLNE